jgi:hypothetical protein
VQDRRHGPEPLANSPTGASAIVLPSALVVDALANASRGRKSGPKRTRSSPTGGRFPPDGRLAMPRDLLLDSFRAVGSRGALALTAYALAARACEPWPGMAAALPTARAAPGAAGLLTSCAAPPSAKRRRFVLRRQARPGRNARVRVMESRRGCGGERRPRGSPALAERIGRRDDPAFALTERLPRPHAPTPAALTIASTEMAAMVWTTPMATKRSRRVHPYYSPPGDQETGAGPYRVVRFAGNPAQRLIPGARVATPIVTAN